MFLHFSAPFRDNFPLAVAASCVQELQVIICLGLFLSSATGRVEFWGGRVDSTVLIDLVKTVYVNWYGGEEGNQRTTLGDLLAGDDRVWTPRPNPIRSCRVR